MSKLTAKHLRTSSVSRSKVRAGLLFYQPYNLQVSVQKQEVGEWNQAYEERWYTDDPPVPQDCCVASLCVIRYFKA